MEKWTKVSKVSLKVKFRWLTLIDDTRKTKTRKQWGHVIRPQRLKKKGLKCREWDYLCNKRNSGKNDLLTIE